MRLAGSWRPRGLDGRRGPPRGHERAQAAGAEGSCRPQGLAGSRPHGGRVGGAWVPLRGPSLQSPAQDGLLGEEWSLAGTWGGPE